MTHQRPNTKRNERSYEISAEVYPPVHLSNNYWNIRPERVLPHQICRSGVLRRPKSRLAQVTFSWPFQQLLKFRRATHWLSAHRSQRSHHRSCFAAGVSFGSFGPFGMAA
jgi:hypothetical protein